MRSQQGVLYVAGPYRGGNAWDTRENIRRAERVAMECWRAGFAVICPHTNAANGEGWLPDHVWMEGDLTRMRRCDAVVVVPDWERSEGTRAEIEMARKEGIPVFFSLADAITYFDSEKPPRMPQDGKTAPGVVS